MKPIFTIVLIFSFAFLGAQNRIYVDVSATGANNGQSWANAFSNLHSALQFAQSGDEIWVASGQYLPTTDANRDSFFSLTSGVKLYGGFAGIETYLTQRDWAAHPTTLSGDIGMPADSTDNSYTILYLDNPDSMTVVDGFRLEWGNASLVVTGESTTNPHRSGGGMYIMGADGEAYPTIRNCHFFHNHAFDFGGGVFINGTTNGSVAPMFLNCVFESNSAGDGGGVYRKGSSWAERTPDFGGCYFLNNYCARWGGGLFYEDTEATDTLQVWDSKFYGNNKGLGAAMFMNIGRQDGSRVVVKGCDFQSNFGSYGAVFNISNILSYSNTDFVRIEDSNISNNSGYLEGIIYLDGFGATDSAKTIVDNCVFFDNKEASPIVLLNVNMSDKGAVSIKNTVMRDNKLSSLMRLNAAGKLSINHCLVVHNKTYTRLMLSARNNKNIEVNNTVFCNNQYDYADGAAITLRAAKVTIRNSVFQHDQMFYQELTPISNPLFSEVEVYNSILSVKKLISYEANKVQTSTLLTHSLLDGVSFDCTNLPQGVTCGPGNLFNLDPMFRDTANNDYRLLPCSPLLNVGLNAAAANLSLDLAGNPRILGGTVDIGAYESTGLALSALPLVQSACVGASNGSISLALEEDGCGPYTYSWLPNAGNGPNLTDLSSGSYIFTITDGSGRQISDTVIVESLPQPSLLLASTDVLCGSTLGGSLTASVQSGTAPFEYQWQPAAENIPILKQLPPGNYALTVTDVHGCQDSATTSIALQGMISLMVDGQVIPCHGETGWLSATPVTGAAPYQWLWQGWPGTDSLAQPLGPGQYSVTVTDAYGCTASNTFPFLNDPSLITANIDSDPQTDLSMPNGAAELTSVGGGSPAFPPLPPYQYNWNNGGMEAFIGGLTAGTYTVTITDKNGCTLALEVVVDLMVGTADPTAQALLIYPNPATDWLRVVLPAQTGACTLELLDESGRVLRSLQLPNGSGMGQLDLQGLASGSYWVRVLEGELVVFGAVVKL